MSEVVGIKISEMSEKTSLTGNEYVPIIDGGLNKKAKLSNITVKTDTELSTTSTNPIANQAVAKEIESLKGSMLNFEVTGTI